MSDYPKRIKRQLREWMVEAYERELKRELQKLDESFAAWRENKISSGELSYRVHQYDRGPSRDLFSKYNDNAHAIAVAAAVVTGILQEEELPAELLEAIALPLNAFRAMRENGELREPGE